MNVKVKVYDRCKYEKESEKIAEIKYDIVAYAIYNIDGKCVSKFGSRAYEIADAEKRNIAMDLRGMAEEDMDKYDEYLRLYLADGNTATFNNSNVDLFAE